MIKLAVYQHFNLHRKIFKFLTDCSWKLSQFSRISHFHIFPFYLKIFLNIIYKIDWINYLATLLKLQLEVNFSCEKQESVQTWLAGTKSWWEKSWKAARKNSLSIFHIIVWLFSLNLEPRARLQQLPPISMASNFYCLILSFMNTQSVRTPAIRAVPKSFAICPQKFRFFCCFARISVCLSAAVCFLCFYLFFMLNCYLLSIRFGHKLGRESPCA